LNDDDGEHEVLLVANGSMMRGYGLQALRCLRVQAAPRGGNQPWMTSLQAWRARSNPTRIADFLACFLGALHGICQRDLIEDLADGEELLAQLRRALRGELAAERSRFLAATGMDEERYRSALGDCADLPDRSGRSRLFDRVDER
jgi:hypothetical protein